MSWGRIQNHERGREVLLVNVFLAKDLKALED
jgi:hypothetical protein